MTEFFAAIAAFLLAHLIPSMPALRARLVQVLGRRVYLALYSLLSVVLLGWIVIAARRADSLPLWPPAPWQWWLTILVMPLAFWFVIAGLIARNSLSITFRASAPDEESGPITAVTRHPVLVGFLLWAASHVPPNGDVVGLVLFGGMALLAVGGIFLVDSKARKRLGHEAWDRLAAKTSIVPLAAVAAGRTALRSDRDLVVATILSLAIYVWFLTVGHRMLIGPDPLATV